MKREPGAPWEPGSLSCCGPSIGDGSEVKASVKLVVAIQGNRKAPRATGALKEAGNEAAG
jgi:hypothetical protein